MVHGLLHSSKVWDDVRQILSRNNKIIGIDLPGFGLSPPLPKAQINIQSYSNLLYNVIESINKNHKIQYIVADSLGAVLVLNLLEGKSINCRHIFLSGCPAFGLPSLFKNLGRANILSNSLKIVEKLPSKVSRSLIKLSSLITFHKTKYVNSSLINSVLSSDPITSQLLLQELSNFNYHPEEAPELNFTVIRGEFDKIISKESSMNLAEILNCEYKEVSGAGHTPMVEKPTYYSKIIEERLTQKD